MSNNMKNTDILMELDIKNEIEKLKSESNSTNEENMQINENTSSDKETEQIETLKKLDIQKEIERLQKEAEQNIIKEKETTKKEIVEERVNKRVSKRKHMYFLSGIIFFGKYLITSTLIFAALLITTNYSAYINIAKSYIFSNQMEVAQQRLVTSVEASNIKENYIEEAKKKVEKTKKYKETSELKETKLSLKKLKKKEDKKNIDLNIQITPYANRVIIPKIGKNIPLLDIKNRNIAGESELNDIFAKELEKGIIRYPSSAKPGEKGNSFIFGHSSNFPWVKGDYNEVFATLDNVSYGDEIIVYYGQKKYKYKVREKKVITPGDVSILERDKNKAEITLMTCWPVGTTLNRLIVVGDLVEE